MNNIFVCEWARERERVRKVRKYGTHDYVFIHNCSTCMHLYLPKQIVKRTKIKMMWMCVYILELCVPLNFICILRYADVQDIYSNSFRVLISVCKTVRILQLPLCIRPIAREEKKSRMVHWLPNRIQNNDGSIFSIRDADAIQGNSLLKIHTLSRIKTGNLLGILHFCSLNLYLQHKTSYDNKRICLLDWKKWKPTSIVASTW